MQRVLEIDAVGVGLFKIDKDIKVALGGILQLRRNKNNEAGRYKLAFELIILLTLSSFIIAHLIFIHLIYCYRIKRLHRQALCSTHMFQTMTCGWQ
jgi:hypothetical protein